MGRLGKSFGPSWAPKTPPRCATWAPRRPQDATKTYPRAAQNTSQDALGSPRPPRTSKTSKMTPKSRWGTPRGLVFEAYMGGFGVGFGAFFIDFWFALDLHFIGILTGSFQEFSKSNPEMKAPSWKIVAAIRALFFARTPSIWEIFE